MAHKDVAQPLTLHALLSAMEGKADIRGACINCGSCKSSAKCRYTGKSVGNERLARLIQLNNDKRLS